MSINLGYHGVKEYIKLECEGIGKGVVFHDRDEIQSPYTTGDTIHLYKPNATWDDKQWDMWLYEVYHETGHESPENRDPYWKDQIIELGINTQSFFGSVLNLLSDHIQEHNRTGKLRGRDYILKRGRSLFTSDRLLSEDVLSKKRDGKKEKAFKVLAVYDAQCRTYWNEMLVGVEHALDYFTEDELEMYNQVIDSGVMINRGTSEEDSYEYTKKLLAALGFDPEEEEQEAQQGEGEGSEEAEDGEGDAESRGEGEGEEKKGSFSDSMEDMIYHVHYTEVEVEGESNKSYSGVHLDYDSYKGGVDSFVPKDPIIVDMKSEDYKGQKVEAVYTERYVKSIRDLQAGDMLANHIKMLLTSMKQTRWQHGHRRGRVSGKNLWKGTRPIYSQDIFKKKAQRLELNTAVTVLCDFSGSMSGDKYIHASKAGIMLNEVLVKIGVPIELLGFSEVWDGPLNVVMSGFNELSVSEDELTRRYATAGNWMCQNSDGESIMWAYNRLLKRKEERKVLIVLSDGSPAAYNQSGDLMMYTDKVIKTIEEGNRAEIYGVGIMDHNVERLYKDHKVINNSSDLEDLLLGLVKNKVLGI